ncbi:hypothetical protein Dimus_031361 [Dionaea muscipula]
MSSSICISLRIWNPPLIHRSNFLFHLLPSRQKLSFAGSCISAKLKDDSSTPARNQLGYDPAQELFGLDVDLALRDVTSGAREPRSWFGPNGQYFRELPCPSCRGRGYTPCTECGIDKSRIGCSQCNGKGMMSCRQCLGDCVIWEESIDEMPWEKARSSSPVKVKDDELDNLDMKLDVKRKSNRVHRSLSPEVRLKISRSLKSLNAKTGLFSKRMKLIHGDGALHAQRVAAIKRAKRSPESRKRASENTSAYFSDPENRRKLSVAMKGLKFHCRNCGREGHRRHFCPELKKAVRNRCTMCRKEGHNKKTCPKLRSATVSCKTCGQSGHSSRTCSFKTRIPLEGAVTKSAVSVDSRGKAPPRRPYRCKVCHGVGHNSRSCSQQVLGQKSSTERSEIQVESRKSSPGNDVLHSEDGQTTPLKIIAVNNESSSILRRNVCEN